MNQQSTRSLAKLTTTPAPKITTKLLNLPSAGDFLSRNNSKIQLTKLLPDYTKDLAANIPKLVTVKSYTNSYSQKVLKASPS